MPVNKRARLGETLKQHSNRRVLCALESALPEEVSWALGSLLLSSAPNNEVAGGDRLSEMCNLAKSPDLLLALLPIALQSPINMPARALQPFSTAAVHTTALCTAHCRQAWLVLRNLSLVQENESPLVHGPGSKGLIRLILHTLRCAFLQNVHELPLAVADITTFGVPEQLSVAIVVQPLHAAAAEGGAICSSVTNQLDACGHRHDRRRGACVDKSASPAMAIQDRKGPPLSAAITLIKTAHASEFSSDFSAPTAGPALSLSSGAQSTTTFAATAEEARVEAKAGAAIANDALASHTGHLPANVGAAQDGGFPSNAGPGPHSPPPSLSAAYDVDIHIYAAELLSSLCRQLRLNEVCASQAHLSGADEVCELLSMMLRSREAPFSGIAIEALGRLSAIDGNDVPLCRMALETPAVVTVLSSALAEEQSGGACAMAAGVGAASSAAGATTCVAPGGAGCGAAGGLGNGTASAVPGGGGAGGGAGIGAGGGASSIAVASGVADDLASSPLLPAPLVLEAAVDAIFTLSSGELALRRHLARDRVLMSRLFRLFSTGASPHVVRRAAQLLLHLAQAAEAHDVFRQYEWVLLHLGMHDALGASAHVGEILDELCER